MTCLCWDVVFFFSYPTVHSCILFNLFLEKIMQETLHDYHTSTSIGGRSMCNPQIAYDIDLMGGSNGELQDLTNRLVIRATA